MPIILIKHIYLLLVFSGLEMLLQYLNLFTSSAARLMEYGQENNYDDDETGGLGIVKFLIFFTFSLR